MNKTTFIIVAGVIVIILFVAAVWYFFSNQQSADYKPTIVNNQLSVTTSSQKELLIANVYSHAIIQYPENGVGFARTNFYEMSYYPKDDGFIITLLDSDVEKARSTAEQDFLKLLNITEKQACTLKISIGVPYSVNKEYAGKDLKFQYCP